MWPIACVGVGPHHLYRFRASVTQATEFPFLTESLLRPLSVRLTRSAPFIPNSPGLLRSIQLVLPVWRRVCSGERQPGARNAFRCPINRKILAKTKQRSVPERESAQKGWKVTSRTQFALYHRSSQFFVCARLLHWCLVVFAESAFCLEKAKIGKNVVFFFFTAITLFSIFRRYTPYPRQWSLQ